METLIPLSAVATDAVLRTREGINIHSVPVLLTYPDYAADGEVVVSVSPDAVLPAGAAWWRIVLPELRQVFRVITCRGSSLIARLTPAHAREVELFREVLP